MPKRKLFLFVDECGDPNFFGKGKRLLVGQPGYQPVLVIGMILTDNRRRLAKSVEGFRKKVLGDTLFNSIASIRESEHWYLHAKDDHPEVRAKFFEVLRKISGFEAHFVIGRKRLDLFNRKHNGKPEEFYFDLLRDLLADKLVEEDCEYQIYLAKRGGENLDRFRKAITSVLEKENSAREKPFTVEFHSDVVLSKFYPELSIVDYLLWALQRYIFKDEGRFFWALESKFTSIVDVYAQNGEGKIEPRTFTREDPFRLEKTAKFE